VILIGLDSADRNLLQKWCESADLPHLRALRDRGAWGPLASEPAVGDDATWASFHTTVSCARHGRFFYKAIEPGSYRMAQSRDQDLGFEPFWAVLSRAGNRVAIIDVPKCPLVTGLNGIQVTDWLVHGRDYETRSWPAGIAADIRRRFGDDATDRWEPEWWLCERERLPEDRYATFVERTLQSIRQKLAFAEEVLDRGDWSLFTVVFKEAHCIGHQCWHLLDETHEHFDAALAERLGDPVRRVYVALDAAVGRLLQRAGPDTTIIVFSDLGMGRNDTGEHLLDAVLRRLERSAAPLWKGFAAGDSGAAAELPPQTEGSPGDGALWQERRLFQLEHNEISGAIRINLAGREPQGRIHRGHQMDTVCDWLRRELLALVDPESGKPLVAQVLRTDAIYSGERLDYLPDLFVVWNRGSPISGAASGTIGELCCERPVFRTGNHLAGGVYFAAGHGVTASVQRSAASIMDVGPSVAMLLGTTLEYSDGKPFAALATETT
jgi:predicted AlkP superfamily phosphohydrolase/phosphomutase